MEERLFSRKNNSGIDNDSIISHTSAPAVESRTRTHVSGKARKFSINTFLFIIDMAVAIRLNRQGSKDRPYYKIVVVDSRARRDGRYIEQVGSYDPMKEGVNYTINLEKVDKWLANGAQPSETVNSMIRKARKA